MHKKKILLAEDNQFILRSFKHLLNEQGSYDIDTVCDGALVVSIVKEFQPDVLVLDLILPNINGFDILKELRSSKEFDTLPIIVATSLGQNEDKEIVMNLGATDYIIKSQITGKDLVDKITKVLE